MLCLSSHLSGDCHHDHHDHHDHHHDDHHGDHDHDHDHNDDRDGCDVDDVDDALPLITFVR